MPEFDQNKGLGNSKWDEKSLVMELEFTRHARDMMVRRGISKESIRQTIIAPDLIYPDKEDDSLNHYLKYFPEKGGRALRVIVNIGVESVRVITVFYDRRMKGSQ